MAALTPIAPAIAGVAFSPASAGGSGDTFANPTGSLLLYVSNGSGSSINVTVAAQSTSRPADAQWPAMTLGDNVVAVGAGAAKLIGPIPTAFNNDSGSVEVAYSSATSVTVAVIKPS